MILYAGTTGGSALEEAFPSRRVRVVETVDAAVSTVEGEERVVLFVDAQDVPADAFAREVRQRSVPEVAVVVVGAASPTDAAVFDARVAAEPTASDLRAAADRARRIVSYRRAVGDFLDQCHGRREADPLDVLSTSRHDADDLFGELPPLDEETLAALLREDE